MNVSKLVVDRILTDMGYRDPTNYSLYNELIVTVDTILGSERKIGFVDVAYFELTTSRLYKYAPRLIKKLVMNYVIRRCYKKFIRYSKIIKDK